jgi:peptide/nickel transport system ATP-binding protein
MTDTADSALVVHGPKREGVAALEARNLTKHFPISGFGPRGRQVVHAVEDISIALPEATVTAVVGESGSGKSTLARLLTGLIEPTSGRILLHGEPLGKTAKARRDYTSQVHLVLQDPFSSLNEAHSVRYHLERPLKLHKNLHGGAVEPKIIELLERVALTPGRDFIDKYPHELSGGQRQRIAIARGLAVGPRVLLADEPVSMLDVSIRLGVLNLFDDLRATERLATMYVTHDIASARYLADAIVVMYAGQVVESGPGTQITDAPKHPYTQLLLSAAPDPSRKQPPVLHGRGSPPSLVSPPSGCRFHPRCPFAMDICSKRTPPQLPVGREQVAACWLHSPEHAPASVRVPDGGVAVNGSVPSPEEARS